MISGILLAAGESSRMQGAFKPLLKWGKRTVIGECVHQMRNSQLAEIFVVLGHREMDIRQTLAGSGVENAINEDYPLGETWFLLRRACLCDGIEYNWVRHSAAGATPTQLYLCI